MFILISSYLVFAPLTHVINPKPFTDRSALIPYYDVYTILFMHLCNKCGCFFMDLSRSTFEGDTTMLITRYTSVLINTTENTMVSPTYVPPHR